MSKPEYGDVDEMSDEEFMALREEALKDRDTKKYGGEFVKVVWRRTYEYRGVKYDIILLRYLNSKGEIGMNRYGKWFVLEPPEGKSTKNSVCRAELDKDAYSEFLFRDTLHSWNERQTIKEMFYEMADYAKSDIDNAIEAIRWQR